MNSHGSVSHQGRLEINGQTRIKPMRSRSVVAQQLSTILGKLCKSPIIDLI